ncbi:MIF4G domain-containing protein B isoform X2 [Hydra vulgaris]|uniref:MIF4G domain-containing protein B isoform X2 n=1 Tax=Hydra vulgaris TaxID=6087 RepID=A0ABM4CNQ9_HYDVU
MSDNNSIISAIGRGRGRGRGRGFEPQNGVIFNSQQLAQGSQEFTPPNLSLSQKSVADSSPKISQPLSETMFQNSQQVSKISESKISNSPVISKSTSANNFKPAVTISSLVENIDKLTENEILSTYPSKIDEYKSEGNIEKLVNLLCEKALDQPDLGPTIAKLCNAIWISESLHNLVVNPLMKAIQDKYKKKDVNKRNSFFGLCVLLCELYKLLRSKNLPLKPLTNPVCCLLKELLQSESPSSEDVFYFYQELESVGEIIEKYSPENMDDIINMTRQLAISSTVSPSARCRLLQLIELRAGSWKMSDDIKSIYEDTFMELIE